MSKSMGAIEAIKEGVQAIAPGLSIGKIVGDLANEGERQVGQGAAELGSALFQGSAYVPYGSRQGVDLDGEKSMSVADILAAGRDVEQAREQQREQGMER